jgi:hypothetical protein
MARGAGVVCETGFGVGNRASIDSYGNRARSALSPREPKNPATT